MQDASSFRSSRRPLQVCLATVGDEPWHAHVPLGKLLLLAHGEPPAGPGDQGGGDGGRGAPEGPQGVGGARSVGFHPHGVLPPVHGVQVQHLGRLRRQREAQLALPAQGLRLHKGGMPSVGRSAELPPRAATCVT